MKEVISINIGQAGVQVSNAAWELFCMEHGVRSDGSRINNNPDDVDEHFEIFFQPLTTTFVPRVISVDFEPTVIDEIRVGAYRQLFHPDQLISGCEDCASNFARGNFTVGKLYLKTVMRQVVKLVENCEAMQGFCLLNSFDGGTGSGFSTCLEEALSLHYGKIPKFQLGIYPSRSMATSTVYPYNTILHAHATMTHTDLSILMDNEAIYNICSQKLSLLRPSYSHINRIIAQLFSSITVSMRFKNFLNSDMDQICTNLIPYPRIHFPISHLSPLLCIDKIDKESCSTLEVTRDIFDPENQLVKCDIENGKFMACVMQFRGNVSPNEVNKAIHMIKGRTDIQFVDWCPTGFKIGINNKPLACPPGSSLAQICKSLAMLSNTTAIVDTWTDILRKFNFMFTQKAFIHWFVGEGLEEGEFTEAFENIKSLEKDYYEISTPSDESVKYNYNSQDRPISSMKQSNVQERPVSSNKHISYEDNKSKKPTIKLQEDSNRMKQNTPKSPSIVNQKPKMGSKNNQLSKNTGSNTKESRPTSRMQSADSQRSSSVEPVSASTFDKDSRFNKANNKDPILTVVKDIPKEESIILQKSMNPLMNSKRSFEIIQGYTKQNRETENKSGKTSINFISDTSGRSTPSTINAAVRDNEVNRLPSIKTLVNSKKGTNDEKSSFIRNKKPDSNMGTKAKSSIRSSTKTEHSLNEILQGIIANDNKRKSNANDQQVSSSSKYKVIEINDEPELSKKEIESSKSSVKKSSSFNRASQKTKNENKNWQFSEKALTDMKSELSKDYQDSVTKRNLQGSNKSIKKASTSIKHSTDFEVPPYEEIKDVIRDIDIARPSSKATPEEFQRQNLPVPYSTLSNYGLRDSNVIKNESIFSSQSSTKTQFGSMLQKQSLYMTQENDRKPLQKRVDSKMDLKMDINEGDLPESLINQMFIENDNEPPERRKSLKRMSMDSRMDINEEDLSKSLINKMFIKSNFDQHLPDKKSISSNRQTIEDLENARKSNEPNQSYLKYKNDINQTSKKTTTNTKNQSIYARESYEPRILTNIHSSESKNSTEDNTTENIFMKHFTETNYDSQTTMIKSPNIERKTSRQRQSSRKSSIKSQKTFKEEDITKGVINQSIKESIHDSQTSMKPPTNVQSDLVFGKEVSQQRLSYKKSSIKSQNQLKEDEGPTSFIDKSIKEGNVDHQMSMKTSTNVHSESVYGRRSSDQREPFNRASVKTHDELKKDDNLRSIIDQTIKESNYDQQLTSKRSTSIFDKRDSKQEVTFRKTSIESQEENKIDDKLRNIIDNSIKESSYDRTVTIKKSTNIQTDYIYDKRDSQHEEPFRKESLKSQEVLNKDNVRKDSIDEIIKEINYDSQTTIKKSTNVRSEYVYGKRKSQQEEPLRNVTTVLEKELKKDDKLMSILDQTIEESNYDQQRTSKKSTNIQSDYDRRNSQQQTSFKKDTIESLEELKTDDKRKNVIDESIKESNYDRETTIKKSTNIHSDSVFDRRNSQQRSSDRKSSIKFQDEPKDDNISRSDRDKLLKESNYNRQSVMKTSEYIHSDFSNVTGTTQKLSKELDDQYDIPQSVKESNFNRKTSLNKSTNIQQGYDFRKETITTQMTSKVDTFKQEEVRNVSGPSSNDFFGNQDQNDKSPHGSTLHFCQGHPSDDEDDINKRVSRKESQEKRVASFMTVDSDIKEL